MTHLVTLTTRSGLLTDRYETEADESDVVIYHSSEDAGEPGPMRIDRLPRALILDTAAALERAPVDPRQGWLL